MIKVTNTQTTSSTNIWFGFALKQWLRGSLLLNSGRNDCGRQDNKNTALPSTFPSIHLQLSTRKRTGGFKAPLTNPTWVINTGKKNKIKKLYCSEKTTNNSINTWKLLPLQPRPPHLPAADLPRTEKNTYRCSIKNRSLQSWLVFELAHIVCRATTVAMGNTVHSRFQEPVAMRPTEYFPNQTMPPPTPTPHLILHCTLSRNLRQ